MAFFVNLNFATDVLPEGLISSNSRECLVSMAGSKTTPNR
jgi:hypothetical protein